MTKQISPAELGKGMNITILNWKPREITTGGLFTESTVTTIEDRSWCGDVLCVEAVQLPYVIVSHVMAGVGETNTKLDTREVSLMELNLDYVKALKREAKS